MKFGFSKKKQTPKRTKQFFH